MRRTLLRGTLLAAGGSASVAAVGLLRNVLIARVMGPAAFGLWQICLIALRLAGECNLGVLHALALDGPVHRASGREREAALLEARAVTVNLLFALLGGLAAGAVLLVEGGPALRASSVLLAGTFVAWQFFMGDAWVLRTRGRFGRLALLQAVFAAVHLAGLLLLLPDRYITGALAAWGGGAAVGVLAIRILGGDRLPLPSAREAGAGSDLVRRGGATWLVGLTFVLLFQVDRVVVALLLGREALGHYGIVALAGSGLLFLPDVLAGVLWTVAGWRYGRGGEDPAVLGSVALQGFRALSLVLAPVLLLGLQATDLLVRVVLPGYQEALGPLRAYLPGVFLLCLTMPLRTLLVTAGGAGPLLRMQSVVLLVGVGTEVAAAALGHGIGGVALSFTGASLLLLALVLRQAEETLSMGARWPRLIGKAAVLAGAAMGSDRLLDAFAPGMNTVAGVLLRLVLPLFLAGLALLPLLRSRGESARPALPSPPSPGGGE